MRSFKYQVLAAAVVVTALGLSACGNLQEETEPEPKVTSMRLAVGNQTITVSNNGTVTGGPITIIRPATAAISASFLTAAGAMDPIAHGGAFQLDVTSANTTLLTFTRTSFFGGTLTGGAAGSTQIGVSLFHIAEDHADFGPFNVPVTVN